MDFELNRQDLRDSRMTTGAAPAPGPGEALLRIESFGLTSNNVTYAVLGDAMKYWNFFPASDPAWGRLNVWGYAHVEESRNPDLATGLRVYGYLPCASHLLVAPDRINEKGFVDAAAHRASLPSAYQGYRDVTTDPVYSPEYEAEHVLFFPLFFTSFLIDDFLDDEDFFGADTVVISSASSKTSIIAAHLLAKRDGPTIVGLTSSTNHAFVDRLGVYDVVVDYDDVGDLPGDRAVYVDVSGNGTVRAAVHAHYGDRLAHSASVGITHWSRTNDTAGQLAGPAPVFFFAPDRIKKRGADWGTARLDQSVADAWTPFAQWASEWLRVERIGQDDIPRAFRELLDGDVDPAAGTIVDL